MSERLGSKNFDFVITAVKIQQQVGGSLAGLVDMVADTVRQRQQFIAQGEGPDGDGTRGRLRRSSRSRSSSPIAITVINPTYMDPLYHSQTGPHADLHRPRDDGFRLPVPQERSSRSRGNDHMTLLLVLAVFCLAGAAFLLGEIVTAPSRQRYVSVRRAATYGKMELPSGTPNEGLRERVVAPLSDVLAKWALKINPRSSKDSVGRRLMAAGVGYRISPTGYLALKALLALVGCFVGSMLGASRGFSGIVIGALMAGASGLPRPGLRPDAQGSRPRGKVRR